MRDHELFARLWKRIDDAQHVERVRVLHEAQKAGACDSNLFVAVRKDYPPEGLDKTAQFIKENSLCSY